MINNNKFYVISVGGSLIVPDEIDYGFLRDFRDFAKVRVSQGDKMILVVGGGKTARKYQDALAKFENSDKDDLDWIGIHSTYLNAQLIKHVLKDMANEEIVRHLDSAPNKFKMPVLISSGWLPGGHSTDYDAVKIAERYEITKIVNLSNIKYVYAEDPRVNPEAKKFDDLSWEDYLKLIKSEWVPGLSTPFDPKAAREAGILGLKVAIIHGKDIDSLENYLDDESFNGTLIHP